MKQGQAFAFQSESKPSQLISIPNLPFIVNNGQVDERIEFYAKASGGDVLVMKSGEIIYSLSRGNITIKEKLLGGKVRKIKGEGETAAKVNYFMGDNPAKWKSNIPAYTAVNLGEAYKGIGVKLRTYGGKAEKLFNVKPGARLKDLKIGLRGAKALRVNDNGELEVDTGQGVIKFTRPVAYQEIEARGKKQEARGKKQEVRSKNKKRQYVEVAYVINPTQSSIVNRQSSIIYGFKIGEYDRTKELVIDPLLSSTFIGGSNNDSANAIAIDSSGNVYIAGKTTSSDYPTISGSYDELYNDTGISRGDVSVSTNGDVFISKLSSDLTTLISSTFIGGGETDEARAIAIDPSSGDVYITGKTISSNYPTKTPYDSSYNDTSDLYRGDVFVSKLSSDLTTLISSTFIGGGKEDYASAIAIDSSGNIYITGETNSSDYPPKSGHNGLKDVFVSKLSGDLTTLKSSTFIGGSDDDSAHAIAIDSSGNIYITGETNSSDYPISTGLLYNASSDAFISKLNSDLSLLSSACIGGSDFDVASAIILSSDNIYVTGATYSSDYPTTSGSYDISYNGSQDVFVSKLSSDLTSLLSSTFIGGDGLVDFANAITADSSGNIYIAGYTSSSNYPTVIGSYDISYNDTGDAFVSKLNGNLNSLIASTFIGGSGSENAYEIAISSDNIYIAGETNSSDYPVTSGASNSSHKGYNDVFISKLDKDLSSPQYSLTVTSSGTGSGTVTSSPAGIDCGSDCSEVYYSGTSVTLTATASSGSTFTGWSGGGCSETDTCTITISADTSITAAFDIVPSIPPPVQYALTVAKTGEGGGTITSSPIGIDCGLDCSENYDSGTSVTLTVDVDSDSLFTGWSGGGCSGTVACPITMSVDTVVTANFDKAFSSVKYTLIVATTGSGVGTVISSPTGIECGSGGSDCSKVFNEGQSVTLTATADSGSTFTGWSGGVCSGTSSFCTVTMDAEKDVMATFKQTIPKYTLTVAKIGEGGGTVTSSPTGIDCGSDCSERYDSGTSVTLTATADSGSTFTGWSGGGCSGTDTCAITISAETSVKANFDIRPSEVSSGGQSSSWCLITSAFGSTLDPNVVTMREFRDRHLLKQSAGRVVVNSYYWVSPTIAGYICKYSFLRAVARWILKPVIYIIEYPDMAFSEFILCFILFIRMRMNAFKKT